MDSSNAKNQTQSLIARLATKFGVEPGKLLKCLTSQVFKQSDGAGIGGVFRSTRTGNVSGL